MKKRVLSGIRATGRLHLGNYLGMVKGMLALQNDPKFEPLFMVADLHAMTTPFDPKKLRQDSREVVMDYLAAGLDPEKAIVFIQSQVPEHTELAYLFSTAVSIARLSHLPTYKDKVKQFPKNNTMALLYYPILMASDILLYKTEALPVGDDQLPHLEITREIAKKMNNLFGTNFPEPKQIKTEGHYIPSLTGEGKMSKSVEGSFINLTDSLEIIKKKVSKIPTDEGTSKDGEKFEGPNFGIIPFIRLYLGEDKVKECQHLYITKGKRVDYKTLKDNISEAIYDELEPIQKKRKELENDLEYVEKVIREGAKKAQKIASKTIAEVKEKMGLK